MSESSIGQLHPGFQADFVVLDRDVWEDPSSCLEATVEDVWVAGKKVI